MQIKVITVGKIKEKYLKEGIAEYTKRLKAYCKLEFIEVNDEATPDNASPGEELKIKSKEGEKIAKHIKEGTYLICLAIEGKQLSSEQLAEKMNNLGIEGKSDLTFVIGGSLGLAEEILKKADFLLSFSKMTFPHQLMRLILVEQVYRGFRIIKGEPYHK